MTQDQWIQIWNVAGTWFSGFATVSAVLVALRLARRAETVRLKVIAGIQVAFLGDGSPSERHVSIAVTNLGERPVTVNTVGWAVGKGKKRKFCIQPVLGCYSQRYPIELAHGKEANFLVALNMVPNWFGEMANGFVGEADIRTLVAQVHTSVGTTVEVKPIPNLLEELERVRTETQPGR